MKLIHQCASLAKLRLSSLVIFTTLIGMVLAPGTLDLLRAFLTILGTILIVSAANTFNCILEKDVDALMDRTKNRPLPTGEMSVWVALVIGVTELALALFLLIEFSNQLTASLGLAGFISYVCLYTPLKRISMSALFVGAVPGAIPPLMGWAFATGSLDVTAWILFWILFFWQLPHFIAIAIFRAGDYQAAGLKTLPQTVGLKRARMHMLLYAGALTLVSLSPVFFGSAGALYTVLTMLTGSVFIALCVAALQDFEILRRTRIVFFATLVYLPLVLGLWLCDSYLRSLT